MITQNKFFFEKIIDAKKPQVMRRTPTTHWSHDSKARSRVVNTVRANELELFPLTFDTVASRTGDWPTDKAIPRHVTEDRDKSDRLARMWGHDSRFA